MVVVKSKRDTYGDKSNYLYNSYFKCRYQVLWAVHFKCRDNSMYHLHIIVNSVSFLDGKMFNSSPEELSRFCMHIQNCSGSPCVHRFASVLSSDDN